MVSIGHRGAEIRQFILEYVERHPRDIATFTAETFGISRQGVHRHLQRLRDDKALCVHGSTRDRRYTLCPRVDWSHTYALSANEAEDLIWQRDIRPLLGVLPENVLDMWQYGFTEMMNNAIEHSAGHAVFVRVMQDALGTDICVSDDGEGIFKKLQRELGLEDERHAVLELGKGKITTNPAHHTGEGIFFTSRMFEGFFILSGNISFMHGKGEDKEGIDLIDKVKQSREGTVVYMGLKNNSSRTTKEVFDRFTTEGDYQFSKTIVPVYLAQYGDEKLISRSQAKRLLTHIDRFKVVVFDFDDVEMIGQAFADEVFRVFAEAHPHIKLSAVNVNTPVEQMIRHAAGHRADAIMEAGEQTAPF